MNAKLDTKKKILDVANCLFARFGYHGTSIRDIAKEADINLASVNYHFKNKMNLYQELFKKNYEWMSNEITKIQQDNNFTTVELSWETYHFFVESGDALINSFKIIITEDVCFPHLIDGEEMDFGPPGQKAFLKVITEEVGERVSLEDRQWAVRVIFNNIVHSAIMMNTHVCKDMIGRSPLLELSYQKKHIECHTEAIMAYLKNKK